MEFRGIIRLTPVALVCAMIAARPPVTTAQSPLPERYQLADLKALEQAFVELAAKVQPTVVAIRTYQIRKGSESEHAVKVPHSQGSGFIIDTGGLIATNAHVVAGAGLTQVILENGWRFDATVRQADPRSDLAVLKIDARELPVVRWGDGDKVRINQWVFACGNPFGQANDDGQPSISYGVISARNRQMTERVVERDPVSFYSNLLETSAAINPGSSGGPLFNIDGEVIGIVTAIETATGVNAGHGFAIPADANIRRVLDTLREGREFRYGWLGVTVDDVEPVPVKRVADSVLPRGARITRVEPSDGPAARAGLKADDVVIELDGQPIQSRDQFIRVVGFTPVGSEVSISYLRKNVRRKATVILGDRGELVGLSR